MNIQRVSASDTKVNDRFAKRQNTAFKRAWQEHISWGANYIKSTGKTNFKLFSFPDAKKVFVEVADSTLNGLTNMKERLVYVTGVATAAFAVTGIKPKDKKSKIYEMTDMGNGVYEANDIKAKPDDKYRFIVVNKYNDINLVKDPYAKKQENIHGWSSIYDNDNYA